MKTIKPANAAGFFFSSITAFSTFRYSGFGVGKLSFRSKARLRVDIRGTNLPEVQLRAEQGNNNPPGYPQLLRRTTTVYGDGVSVGIGVSVGVGVLVGVGVGVEVSAGVPSVGVGVIEGVSEGVGV